MHGHGWLAERFDAESVRLHAVARRMLGSAEEAAAAVEEARSRLGNAPGAAEAASAGWLTSVVGRVCLERLRTRRAGRTTAGTPPRAARPGGGADPVRAVDPVAPVAPTLVLVEPPAPAGPDPRAPAADSVGLALLVVLEGLAPAERLAFVLHDMFAVSFDEIGRIVECTPREARRLAAGVRHRLHGPEPSGPAGGVRGCPSRAVVDAVLAAARGGDLDALVEVLDPDVVAHTDGGPDGERTPATVRGAVNVARRALAAAPRSRAARPALVNGSVGILAAHDDRRFSVLSFEIAHGRVLTIDVVTDPERLGRLDLVLLAD